MLRSEEADTDLQFRPTQASQEKATEKSKIERNFLEGLTRYTETQTLDCAERCAGWLPMRGMFEKLEVSKPNSLLTHK